MNATYKAVSQEEFYRFVDRYPRQMITNTFMAAEPPLVQFIDPTLGTNHWDCIIAFFDGGEPCEHYGWDYKRTYKILDAKSNSDEME